MHDCSFGKFSNMPALLIGVTCTEVDGKCSLLVEDPLPDAVHHAGE